MTEINSEKLVQKWVKYVHMTNGYIPKLQRRWTLYIQTAELMFVC